MEIKNRKLDFISICFSEIFSHIMIIIIEYDDYHQQQDLSSNFVFESSIFERRHSLL
jgi:hypothetical protein